MNDLRTTYLKDIIRTYRNYKSLGENALAQVPDASLHSELDVQSFGITGSKAPR